MGCADGNVVWAKDGEEDWTGVKDGKMRRKLRNRLNARVHRKVNAKFPENLLSYGWN